MFKAVYSLRANGVKYLAGQEVPANLPGVDYLGLVAQGNLTKVELPPKVVPAKAPAKVKQAIKIVLDEEKIDDL
jgi:hypothetical protein